MLHNWTLPARNYLMEESNDYQTTLTAAADVVDNGDAYKLILEMPGVSQDQLRLDLERRELVVRGSRQSYGDDHKVLYNGRYAGSALERRFSIGEDVERDGITAELKEGLLVITLPRKATEKTRKIDVQVK